MQGRPAGRRVLSIRKGKERNKTVMRPGIENLVETEAARVVEIREKPLRAVNVAVLTVLTLRE